MTHKDEALKQALEALTIIRGQLKSWGLGDEAIAVCKQALAAQPAPVQQVAATITISRRGAVNTIDNHFEDCVRDWPDGEYKLVLATPPAQPEQEEDLYDLAVKADNWGQP
jgi:hypothetical protein